MNTIEKTSQTTANKIGKMETVAVYLPGDKRELYRLAEEAGTTGTNLARILIRDGLERLRSGEINITCPDITPNADGSFDLHGDLAARVRSGAVVSGITTDECADLAIQLGLEIMGERGFHA